MSLCIPDGNLMTRPDALRRNRLLDTIEVERILRDLGLTPSSAVRGGISYRTLPDGLGWCQVLSAPEEAWPPGATRCVVVRWYPDRTWRRDTRTGLTPTGAEEHWKARTKSLCESLRTLGYQAEITGPQRVPSLHANEDILVWRQDHDELWPPPCAWEGSEPARPHLGQPAYVYPERDPLRMVQAVLSQTQSQWAQPHGTLMAQQALAVLWPPYAELCVRVLWRPAPAFLRHPDGAVPAAAGEHWRGGIDRVRRGLTAAGYHVREPERERTPALDDYAGFLAWRGRRQ